MADIDSLEIEISAESSDAAQKVNALAQALERLKSAIQGSALSSVSRSISGVGDAATAAEEKVNKRRQAIRNAAAPSGTSLKQTAKDARDMASAFSAISRLERELARAEAQAEEFGQELRELQDKLDLEMEVDVSSRNQTAIGEIAAQIGTIEQKADSADDRIRKLRSTIETLKDNLDGVSLEGVEDVPSLSVDSAVEKYIERTTAQIKELKRVTDSIEEPRIKQLLPFDIGDQMTERLAQARKMIDEIKKDREVGGYEPVINKAVNADGLKELTSQANIVSDALEEAKGKLADLQMFAMASLKLHPSLDKSELTEIAQLENAIHGLSETYEDLTQRIAQFNKEQSESGIGPGFQKEIEAATQQVEALQDAAEQVKGSKINIGLNQPGAIDESGMLSGLTQIFSGTKLGGKLGNISSIVQEFDKMGSAATAAGAAAQGAGAAGAGAMASLAAAIGPVVAILEVLKQKFNENKEFLQSDRSLWTDTSWENAGEGLTNLGAALMTVNPLLKSGVYAMRSFIQPGQELLGVLSNLAESGFKKAGAALQEFAASGFNKAGDAVKSMVGNIGNGLKSIGPKVGQLLVKPFSSAISAIQKWQASLGKLIFYKAINAAMRTVSEGIREGIDNLYQFSSLAGGRFASSMDSLASSSLYLKNSLGAMAAPLINAVAPAIEFIIARISALINMLGALFAVLTGQGSFVKATKSAGSFGDAVGGAAGAAKELQDYMLGIDELNVIKDSSGGGGGGGGGGLDFTDMFEEVPLPDWAKEMQEAIKNGDWYHAGEILAEHLNGIIADWDAEAWGKKLGEKINHGLDFALGFLRKFDWDQFGTKIAEAINGIGEGINFDTLGRVIGAGWNAVFKTANGFFQAIDWKMWGRNIAAAINGFVDEVEWDTIGETFSNGVLGLLTMFDEAIRGIEWYKLGSSLAEMLNAVKWEKIITLAFATIQDAIKGAAEALRGFCENFNWDEVANAIANGINSGLTYLSESEWREIGSAIGGAFTKGFEFVKTILDGIDWPQLGRNIVALLNGVNWRALLEAAGGAIAAGFNGIIDTLWEIVSNQEFWSKLGDGVRTGVKAFFEGFHIGKAVDGLSKAITNGINLAIQAIKGLVEAESFWQELGEGIKSGINNFFENVNPQEMSDAFFGLLQRVIDTAIVAISELAANAEWWAGLGTAIGTGINGLIENTDWEALFTSLVKLATGILNGLTNALRAIDWDAAWQAIKEAIDAVDWGPLVEAAMGFFAEAFKAKMKLKLFEGDMFLTIGGDVGKALLNGVLEGLESIPILGWFVLFGESVITLMKDAGALAFAVFTGKWNEIPGLLETATDDMHNITVKWGEKMKGTTEDTMSGVQTSINTHMGAGRDDVRRLTEEMRTAAAEKFQQLKDDAAEKMKSISELVHTSWWDSKNSTEELVGSTASIAADLFEGMRLTVETKTGNIKETSGKNWADTKTDTQTNLESMATSTDTNYGNIQSSVKTHLTSTEAENKAKWVAMEATTKAQQIAMNTSTVLQYAAMNRSITTALNETNSTTTSKWGEIVKTTTNKAGEVLSTIKEKFGKVSSEVTSGLNAAKAAAAGVDFTSVGRNIIDGVSAGVRAKARELANTVSNSILDAARAARQAAQIHSPSRLFRDAIGVYIVPGIAEGVDRTAGTVVSALERVNDLMLSSIDLNDITAPKELDFPVHEDVSRRYAVEYEYDTSHEDDTAERFSESIRESNGQVVDTLYAIAVQLVEAINMASERQPAINLDGKQLMQNNEKHQLQRGANIFGGGGVMV